MDIQYIFSKNLKYYLDLNNKTQEDLSKDLNIHRSVVSTWCRGTAFPRADKIMLLSDYFNIDFIDLFIDKNDLNNHYTKEIVSILSKLDDEYKDILINQARGIANSYNNKR